MLEGVRKMAGSWNSYRSMCFGAACKISEISEKMPEALHGADWFFHTKFCVNDTN